MAYKIHRVLIHTAKTTYPIHVRTFYIKSDTEKKAEKKAMSYANKENPDKPKNYYFATAVGTGKEEDYKKTINEVKQ